jgi:hypothetical protein
MASDFAMSMPAFDTARHDVWYADGGTGFYVVHLANWPADTHAAKKKTKKAKKRKTCRPVKHGHRTTRRCVSRRS